VERREDRYLWLPGIDFLGVKIRGGRLELKRRLAEHGAWSWTPAVQGRVATWRKWPIELGEEGIGVRDHNWVAIKKERELRKFAVESKGKLKDVLPDAFPKLGCGVELTKLAIGGTAWWSVAFEAFGSEEKLAATMETVAARMLAEGLPIKLAVKDSFDYPRWLTLARKSRG
jgi:hypothetical protein